MPGTPLHEERMRKHRAFLLLLAWLALGFWPKILTGQAPVSPSLTLRTALSWALNHSPEVQAARARLQSAEGGVDEAHSRYWPELNAFWQTNRGTDNNLTGLLLPQTGMSSISGPVRPAGNGQSAWNSAGGVFMDWQVWDFGRRGALLAASRDSRNAARARVDETLLELANDAGQLWLDAAVAQEEQRVAAADVQRRKVLVEITRQTTASGLRPGADDSRAQAELAAARIRLAQTAQAVQVARLRLTALLNLSTPPRIDTQGVVLPPSIPGLPVSMHPRVRAASEEVASLQQTLRAIQRGYAPSIQAESTVYGRGSQWSDTGIREGAAGGLGLQRSNWAVGVTINIPMLAWPQVHAREHQVAGALGSARAQQTRQQLDVDEQRQAAVVEMTTARQILQLAPVEVTSARQSEQQAEARYRAGLGDITPVVDAQALLAAAEAREAQARFSVWRAWLNDLSAQGDTTALRRFASGGNLP